MEFLKNIEKSVSQLECFGYVLVLETKTLILVF
jgi:hypothetical protein